jgi:hypothetical protein
MTGRGVAYLLHTRFIKTRRGRMHFHPQCASCCHRINSDLAPPSDFVAMVVDLAVVASAQWHGELITDLASERPILGESKVMCIRWTAPANQARLLRHKFNMHAVTDAARDWQRQDGFINP